MKLFCLLSLRALGLVLAVLGTLFIATQSATVASGDLFVALLGCGFFGFGPIAFGIGLFLRAGEILTD